MHLRFLWILWVICFSTFQSNGANSTNNLSNVDSLNTPITFKNKNLSIRFSNGIQRSYYTELGIAYQISNFYSNNNFAAIDMYFAGVYVPSLNNARPQVWGAKVGSVLISNMSVLGLDIMYLNASGITDYYITPKVGLGSSMLYFTYGYSFSLNNNAISRIGKHQFALTLNIPFSSKE